MATVPIRRKTVRKSSGLGSAGKRWSGPGVMDCHVASRGFRHHDMSYASDLSVRLGDVAHWHLATSQWMCCTRRRESFLVTIHPQRENGLLQVLDKESDMGLRIALCQFPVRSSKLPPVDQYDSTRGVRVNTLPSC